MSLGPAPAGRGLGTRFAGLNVYLYSNSIFYVSMFFFLLKDSFQTVAAVDFARFAQGGNLPRSLHPLYPGSEYYVYILY